MTASHKISIKRFLSVYFTLIVTMYSFNNRYASPIPYVLLQELLLFAFWALALATGRSRLRFAKAFFPICVYLTVQLVLALYAKYSSVELFDVFGAVLRLLFMYTTLAMFARSYFDFRLGVKLVRFFAVCASVYALIQTVAFKVFHIYLGSNLPFLPVLNQVEEHVEYVLSTIFNMPIRYYRANSFFSEPSYLCMYLTLALVLELHFQKRHWVAFSALYCVVCFVDRSSTGIIMSVFIVGVFFLKNMKNASKRFFVNSMIVIAFFVIGAVFFVARSEIWEYFIDRTFAGRGVSLTGLSQNGRFSDWDVLAQNGASLYRFMLGSGYGVGEGVYLPGFVRAYFCLGVIGLILYIGLCWNLWRHARGVQRMIAAVYIILNIGSEVFFSVFTVTIIPFLLVQSTVEAETVPQPCRIPARQTGQERSIDQGGKIQEPQKA